MTIFKHVLAGSEDDRPVVVTVDLEPTDDGRATIQCSGCPDATPAGPCLIALLQEDGSLYAYALRDGCPRPRGRGGTAMKLMSSGGGEL
ncbi:hypothetical protein LCGC14_2626400 [marine sediment metagenome]|uniref:Uncharacterized protein n=1 Tax=marine sediment metagenome TaxID=412755 RepID=A0A0F9CU30_9ZZZZ